MVVDSNGMQELGYPVRACSRVLKEHVLELLKSMTLRRNKVHKFVIYEGIDREKPE